MWECEIQEAVTAADHEDGDADAPVWERRHGEPARWYARFEAYRLLGPSRTMRAAYRRCGELEGLSGRYPNSRWFQIAGRWQWRMRAEAWDQEQREELREAEKAQRIAAHHRRSDMVDSVLGVAFRTMMRAALDAMQPEQARAVIPTVRLLFKDMLNEQRKELGMPDGGDSDGRDGDAAPFTADELAAAQRELAQWLQTQDQDTEE